MYTIIYALIAASVIYSIWQLTLYLAAKYKTEVDCPSCDGKGWYMTVREKEKCKVCGGTGKRG